MSAHFAFVLQQYITQYIGSLHQIIYLFTRLVHTVIVNFIQYTIYKAITQAEKQGLASLCDAPGYFKVVRF